MTEQSPAQITVQLVQEMDREIAVLRDALNAIIERSNTDEFGTSKVNDMRRIAEEALARKKL